MATITKRGDAYRIRVSCGYDVNGKQIMKSTTWTPAPGISIKKTEKELQKQAVLFEEKCQQGRVLDGHTRFADFTEEWFKVYAEPNLSRKTVQSYLDLVPRTYSGIGHIYLDKLQPHHLLEFYANLQEDNIRADTKYCPIVDFKEFIHAHAITGKQLAETANVSVSVVKSLYGGRNVSFLSAQRICTALDVELGAAFLPAKGKRKLTTETIRHYHRFISSVLGTAVQWGAIASNPCSHVKPPRAARKEPKYLGEDMVRTLLDCLELEEIKYQSMIYMLLFTGLRRGELCALQWGDIDFEQSLTSVTKAASYIPGKGITFGEPKNSSSCRVIKTPVIAVNKLRVHKVKQAEQRIKLGDKWKDSGLIFTTWDGHPIHPDSISGWFRHFVERSELPQITLHSLRHTNATLMIANNVDVRTVSGRLGHAQTSTTMNIYAHALKSANEAASDALDDIFGKNSAEIKMAK